MDNLYLTGFMGCGKSTVGRRLASLLGRRFLDLDAAVARREGRAVAALIRQSERRFRGLEYAALRRAARRRRCVIALGGGALLSGRNRALVRSSGVLIWLTAPRAELKRRLRAGREGRPLLAQTTLSALLAARRPGYETADLRASTAGRPPARSAAFIARLLRDRGFL